MQYVPRATCPVNRVQPLAVLRRGRSIPLRVLGIAAVLALLVLPIAHTVFGALIAVQQAKLLAADGAANSFGFSVAISGDTAIVGANQDDDNGEASGSAYVFTRSGGLWSQQQKLLASDGAEVDFFGFSVAILGDTAIVGAPNDDNSSGSVYVFTRSGVVWSQQQKLTASDGAAQDNFGSSVAVSGDTAIVGAPLDDDNGNDSGSAYVFTRSGGLWNEQQKLLASDGAEQDNFGASIAISGDTAIVAAPGDDDTGSAYVFTLEADNIPPETSIDSAVDGKGTSLADGDSTLSDSIEITFSGTDNVGVASFECSLDGAAFSTCTSPFTASGLSLGSHTFEVRAIDTAGNTDPTPASFIWTIVTPAEATQELIEDVEALNLQRGIENSLSAQLDSAFQSLENGNVQSAINSLEAFINTVEAQAGKKIPQEDADRLIASAQSIIDALSSS